MELTFSLLYMVNFSKRKVFQARKKTFQFPMTADASCLHVLGVERARAKGGGKSNSTPPKLCGLFKRSHFLMVDRQIDSRARVACFQKLANSALMSNCFSRQYRTCSTTTKSELSRGGFLFARAKKILMVFPVHACFMAMPNKQQVFSAIVKCEGITLNLPPLLAVLPFT